MACRGRCAVHAVPMRRIANLAALIALLAAAPALGEQPGPIEAFGGWRLAWAPREGAWTAWTQASGTVTAPDVCRGFVENTWPEKFPPGEAAAIGRGRAACMVLACKPADRSGPRRYDLTLILFGRTGPAEDHRPGLVLRGAVRLVLSDGPLTLDVGLTTPVPVNEAAKPRTDLILFPAAALERSVVERLLRSRTLRVPAIRERFAAYIWAIPYTIGAYAFDLAGGPQALARLDERCR